jgi:hypothetical protein
MSQQTQWEYRVATLGGTLGGIKDDALEAELNEWGQAGWEVISVAGVESTNKVRVAAKRLLTRTTRRHRSWPEAQ